MKTVPSIKPTPEQLPIIQNVKPGITLIRGAAGSGKTSTAILRLRQLAAFWLARRTRLQQLQPIRFLVVTFNKTLRGYIAELTDQQLASRKNLELTISTFGSWSKDLMSPADIVDPDARSLQISSLAANIPLPADFILSEVDYLLGRFLPTQLSAYLDCSRDGRGASPRVDRPLRKRILAEIVDPYVKWKQAHSLLDWNDLATGIKGLEDPPLYDIILADESQDLSANEVRALMHCAASPSSITFVLDAAQRIYPRGFTWKEAGVEITPSSSYRLSTNHRNSQEICKFALPLLEGMDVGDDGTFPDFKSCGRSGPTPIVLKGKYSGQITFALDYISKYIDLSTDSVAFLKPFGGGWFSTIRKMLEKSSFAYVELTRASDWPPGTENIALSTMHSGKGLEFDHVFILGLNAEVTPSPDHPEDSILNNLRRLLAMAITRARKTVILGYKPSEASKLIQYLDPDTFQEVTV